MVSHIQVQGWVVQLEKPVTIEACQSLSPQSYGHTGFTGTFVWVDPVYETFIVFLTNRVYPNRSQRGLYQLGIRSKLVELSIGIP